MNRIKEALEIYETDKDMDYLDYIETYDEDVEYIADLLKTRTREEVLELLTE